MEIAITTADDQPIGENPFLKEWHTALLDFLFTDYRSGDGKSFVERHIDGFLLLARRGVQLSKCDYIYDL